jgi:N-methylhydantoinase A
MNIVGVDIGGTFTDLVGCVDGRIVTSKCSTVPADPTRGVAESLRARPLRDAGAVGAAARLDHRHQHGAGAQWRAHRADHHPRVSRHLCDWPRQSIEAFNLFFHRPKPLIPRELTFEVTERINAKGEVLKPLAENEVEALAKAIAGQGIESVAVCFLHAYANPAHERRVGEILRAANPRLFVTLSHEIVREYREYERTSTTALNAFVGPRVQAYLGRLEHHLRDGQFPGKLNIMRSNGGVMSVRLAQEQPVSMMESGPVAGVIGAGRLAAMLGIERVIGFDMGGTTAKASLITKACRRSKTATPSAARRAASRCSCLWSTLSRSARAAARSPGADCDGGIHVGPKSAGRRSGPAAYGKGSTDPVVTDANLVLGRINAGRFSMAR